MVNLPAVQGAVGRRQQAGSRSIPKPFTGDARVEPEAVNLLAQILVRRPEIGAALWELLVIIESGGHISVNGMAERLGADRRTVVTHVRSLEAAGLIERQPVRGLAHRYAVTFLTSDNGCH
jgi:DNA-binding transcriptional ArsR family regulator